jgi:hypothetical protein
MRISPFLDLTAVEAMVQDLTPAQIVVAYDEALGGLYLPQGQDWRTYHGPLLTEWEAVIDRLPPLFREACREAEFALEEGLGHQEEPVLEWDGETETI